MQWYETVFELIDMRSFSNLWYWIALAVLWSTASHWVLGVPYDLVMRARRSGGEAEADLQHMVRINVRRLLYIAQVSGLWLVGLVAFGLTVLGMLGFYYGVEFAQAVLCLLLPLSLVGMLSLRTARRIAEGENEGPALHRRLLRHRMAIQGIGMFAIFVTAMWGMLQNLRVGAL
ncbi:component of SufBCD complex [Paracoccaceae bacterium Fryx2]|nr:component of SufBCD complex [Paracoccaceae bacterium Fryx2]